MFMLIGKNPCAWHRGVALFLVSPPPFPVCARQPWALHSETAYTLAGTWLQELGRRKTWVCLPAWRQPWHCDVGPSLKPPLQQFLGTTAFQRCVFSLSLAMIRERSW